MLKIDVDDIDERDRFTLQRIMYCIPRPFTVRLSSSRAGLHIRAPACQEWDYRRFCWDDPMRIALDEQRARLGIPVKNLLWDVKNGLSAGDWWTMNTERDIEQFLDAVKPLTLIRYRAHK